MDKDRRKFKRFDAYLSVKYSLPQERKSSTIALSRDLSREGICISAASNIPAGSVLDLEIDVPDDPRPIRSTGKVMWSHNAAGEDGISHGVRFLAIDPVDKFRVLDYAYNNWLEGKVNDFQDPEEISEI